MGRRGYLRIKDPEHGDCVTGWAQEAFYNFLSRTRLDVCTDNEWAPESAGHWDISIPYAWKGEGRRRRIAFEYDYVARVVKRLRSKPGLVTCKDDVYGDRVKFGMDCASLLEQGLRLARRKHGGTITIDWF